MRCFLPLDCPEIATAPSCVKPPPHDACARRRRSIRVPLQIPSQFAAASAEWERACRIPVLRASPRKGLCAYLVPLTPCFSASAGHAASHLTRRAGALPQLSYWPFASRFLASQHQPEVLTATHMKCRIISHLLTSKNIILYS